MTEIRSIFNRVRYILRGSIFVLACCTALPSYALPAYARQTGQQCVACHVAFPELTPYGRLFKLSGYTIGTAQTVPLAVMAVASVTRVANTQGNDAAYPRENKAEIEGGSIFLAGKIGDHVGMFSQWTYNNLNTYTAPDGSTGFGGVTTADNNDWRLVNRVTEQEHDFIYGLSLNNNPTVQDVWNGTPAFGYPFQASRLAGIWGIGTPATLIEGGLAQQSMGLTAYTFINKQWYLEAGTYKVADGIFSAFSHRVPISNRLKGENPYYRAAYNREWGNQSFEFGLFGLHAKVNTDSTNADSPTDKFNDFGLDAQYQYLSDPHSITAQVSFINERTHWDASHIGVDHDTDSSTLHSQHMKVSYWYQHQFGATLSRFQQNGSTDWLANPVNGVPNTQGWIAEADYNILQNLRLGLQYTDYSRYQGVSSNYDGLGRNARDNNTTYLYLWMAY